MRFGNIAKLFAGNEGLVERNIHEYRNLLGKTKAEDIIWWKLDDNHHQSVIIFSSEELAKSENEQRQAMRDKTSSESNITMVEEFMGPILSQLSSL